MLTAFKLTAELSEKLFTLTHEHNMLPDYNLAQEQITSLLDEAERLRLRISNDEIRMDALRRELESRMSNTQPRLVGWFYEHPTGAYSLRPTSKRWTKCEAPWTETPLYANVRSTVTEQFGQDVWDAHGLEW